MLRGQIKATNQCNSLPKVSYLHEDLPVKLLTDLSAFYSLDAPADIEMITRLLFFK
jgi:hypothetical protein